MEKLLSIDPDVAVIPECSMEQIARHTGKGLSGFWVGNLYSKGLGVIARNGWKLTPLAQITPPAEWVTAYEVKGPENFTLIAVWPVAKGYVNYVRTVKSAIAANPAWFSRGPAVMAGEFNSNSRWDEACGADDHTSVVQAMRKLGIESAYHHRSGDEQGGETSPTYHHQWKTENGFHLDYVLVPSAWLRHISGAAIGSYEEWGGFSDHLPVIVDVALP